MEALEKKMYWNESYQSSSINMEVYLVNNVQLKFNYRLPVLKVTA